MKVIKFGKVIKKKCFNGVYVVFVCKCFIFIWRRFVYECLYLFVKYGFFFNLLVEVCLVGFFSEKSKCLIGLCFWIIGSVNNDK